MFYCLTTRLVKAAIAEGLKIRAAGSTFSYSNLYPDESQLLIKSTELRSRVSGPAIELNNDDVS